jgi:hypothetical protein
MSGAASALLADGRRLHLQHGPIDLIIEAFGTPGEIRQAYQQAIRRFDTVLDELVAELEILRHATTTSVRGKVAKRMLAATDVHAGTFVTPMAAVAGAVADEIIAALVAGRSIERAYVNNGGDIALHLAAGESFDVGMALEDRPAHLAGRLQISADDAIRGIATSGHGGRSLSLGIADSVTVLARCAAAADAAATLIANAVDLPDHPAISRQPAHALDLDSDLGTRLVTTGVGALSAQDIAAALTRGQRCALEMKNRGLIAAASLSLQGEVLIVGDNPRPLTSSTILPRQKEVVHA